MRFLSLFLPLIPSLAMADSFALTSPVSHVTVYPQGATVTRDVSFDIPQGQHDLILLDLPSGAALESVRVKVEGARMGALTLREDFVPPRPDNKSEDVMVAEALIKSIEADIQNTKDTAEKRRLASRASDVQVRFLEQLGSSDSAANLGTDALREMSRMIRSETLNAEEAAHQAEIEARAIEVSLENKERDLEKARQALQALTPDSENRSYLSVAVESDAATTGKLQISYVVDDAAWYPIYDMYLTRGATPSVEMERGAFVQQYTGENWGNVKLTLSTAQPSSEAAASNLYPWRQRIQDPAPARPKLTSRIGAVAGAMAEPMIESPVIVDATEAHAQFDGYAVVYEYPLPVDIASGADAVRLKLDRLTTGAEIFARAVPLYDDTAFMVASITNDTGEVLLPSQYAMLYVDGVFAGASSDFAGLQPLEKAELPFGSIDGLRLERTILSQTEGGKGLITTSNQRTQQARIELRNLTNDTWPIRLFDRVPYSEQDDLRITWQATPEPTEANADNKRGILRWDMTLPPKTEQVISLEHSLSWPEGKELR